MKSIIPLLLLFHFVSCTKDNDVEDSCSLDSWTGEYILSNVEECDNTFYFGDTITLSLGSCSNCIRAFEFVEFKINNECYGTFDGTLWTDIIRLNEEGVTWTIDNGPCKATYIRN